MIVSPSLRKSNINREDKSPVLNKYLLEEEKKLSMDDYENEEGVSIENVDDSPDRN